MAKALVEIRSLARSHTRTALRVLVGIMRCKDATPAARVSAANAILDRGWGKATQPLENGSDGPLEAQNRELCRAIRAGEIVLDAPGLLEHLRATTLAKLAVDQPRYSGYRRALEEPR